MNFNQNTAKGFGPVPNHPEGSDANGARKVAGRSIVPDERATLSTSVRIGGGAGTVTSINELAPRLHDEVMAPTTVESIEVEEGPEEEVRAETRESGFPPPGHQAAGLRVVRPPADDEAQVVRFRRKGTGRQCQSFAVTSGKGGVGKTQLSANLGVALAARGYRVLMLDADVGLASLDLALGIKPHDDLRAVIRGDAEIEEVLCEGPHQVHVVPACPGRYDMANMSDQERGRLQTAVDELSQEYDVLLVDTGAGIGSNAVSFAAGTDEVILVVTPDPTSLRDAYAMAKVLHRRSGVDRIHVVANQVSGDSQGMEVFERLDAIVQRFMTLQLDYMGCIPHHNKVREAVAQGTPYVISEPRGVPARAVNAMARRLLPPLPPRKVS